jgi:hypothetical protein
VLPSFHRGAVIAQSYEDNTGDLFTAGLGKSDFTLDARADSGALYPG